LIGSQAPWAGGEHHIEIFLGLTSDDSLGSPEAQVVSRLLRPTLPGGCTSRESLLPTARFGAVAPLANERLDQHGVLDSLEPVDL